MKRKCYVLFDDGLSREIMGINTDRGQLIDDYLNNYTDRKFDDLRIVKACVVFKKPQPKG